VHRTFLRSAQLHSLPLRKEQQPQQSPLQACITL
jgi:hypothetical protein